MTASGSAYDVIRQSGPLLTVESVPCLARARMLCVTTKKEILDDAR
jgi:hypothetical protein